MQDQFCPIRPHKMHLSNHRHQLQHSHLQCPLVWTTLFWSWYPSLRPRFLIFPSGWEQTPKFHFQSRVIQIPKSLYSSLFCILKCVIVFRSILWQTESSSTTSTGTLYPLLTILWALLPWRTFCQEAKCWETVGAEQRGLSYRIKQWLWLQG